MNATFRLEDALTCTVSTTDSSDLDHPSVVLSIREGLEELPTERSYYLTKSEARAIASALMGAAAEL